MNVSTIFFKCLDEKEKFKDVYSTCTREEYCSVDNEDGCERKTSALTRLMTNADNVDTRSPEKLKELRRADECTAFDVAESSYKLSTNVHSLNDLQHISEIAGYSCKLNKSSSVVLMDSLEYEIYAKRLGIDLSQRPDRTSLVILDPVVSFNFTSFSSPFFYLAFKVFLRASKPNLNIRAKYEGDVANH